LPEAERAIRRQVMLEKKVLSCIVGVSATLWWGAGCRTERAYAREVAARPVQLEYQNWMLEEVGGVPARRGSMNAKAAQMTFSGVDGRVSGYTGVNQFNGPYERRGQALVIGPVAMTRRAGPAEWMEQEAAFGDALARTAAWRAAGSDRIELIDANGWVLARFVREGAR
jgi:heat shock protein HslJ